MILLAGVLSERIEVWVWMLVVLCENFPVLMTIIIGIGAYNFSKILVKVLEELALYVTMRIKWKMLRHKAKNTSQTARDRYPFNSPK